MTKKYTLAMRLNCSHNDFGNQDKIVYLVVVIAFDKPLVLFITAHITLVTLKREYW